MTDVDLRSYFPEFKRSVSLPDGVEYSVRELSDVPIGTFNRIVDDEKNFQGMPFLERHAIERQHLQALVVSIVTTRGIAAKGERTLRLAGDGEFDLTADDVIHVSGGLYFERNTVASISDDKRSATVENAWRFDASEGARVYRSVRPPIIDQLSFIEFAELIVKVKTPPPAEAAKDGEADPPTAASGSTSSTTNSLP